MTHPILVTGGAGFVGSHVCKALSRAGFLPVVYDNLSNGRREAVRWGPLEVADVADAARLADTLARWRPVAVMHFAAFIEAGESVAAPGRFYANNTVGTLTLARAMLDAGVTTLVASSTAAVYGEPLRTPITEDHPCAPINPYGRSKWMMEQMLSDLSAAEGLRYTALRYFNAAGADPEGELGENHEPETHLIPLVLQAAHGLRPSITLFGSDYPTPDGTCIRDFVHVSDLAQAHVLALERLLAGGTSTALNLGTGRGHSVRTVIETAERVTGRTVPVMSAPRRAGDPAMLVASSEAARALLGWSPRHPELDDMVRHAAAWAKRPIHRDGLVGAV